MSMPRYKPYRSEASATNITATLALGPALYGAAGWGLDRLLGTGFFVLLGVVIGSGASVYLVWVKWGR